MSQLLIKAPQLVEDDVMQSLTFIQANIASDKASMAEYLMAIAILKDYNIFSTPELVAKIGEVGERRAVIHFINVAFFMKTLQKNKN